MKKPVQATIWMFAMYFGGICSAQVTTTEEVGPDGVRFRVTRQVVQRSIPTTQYQTQQQKVYRPQVTTEYQTVQQTYAVPVTEYRVVPRLRNWWDPFGGAYWTNEIEPVTRWEARPATVQVPVARTKWVEETQTTQVPVTTYRTVAEEYTSKTFVSATAAAVNTQVAVAPAATSSSLPPPPIAGGEQYQGDPPRSASRLSSGAADNNPYRR
jgi:hypothetical protein